MLTLPSRAIRVRIEASFDTAYAQLSDPATWPSWAAGLGAGLTPGEDGVWTINTVEGESPSLTGAKCPCQCGSCATAKAARWYFH
jgi:hypothetical protein